MIQMSLTAWLSLAALLAGGGFLALASGRTPGAFRHGILATLASAALAGMALVRSQVLPLAGLGLVLVILLGGLALLSLVDADDEETGS